MGVVIETCVKYPGGPTRMNATDLYIHNSSHRSSVALAHVHMYS